jgi:hypothetical protein
MIVCSMSYVYVYTCECMSHSLPMLLLLYFLNNYITNHIADYYLCLSGPDVWRGVSFMNINMIILIVRTYIVLSMNL